MNKTIHDSKVFQRGAYAVEFSFVLIVLLLVIFGVIELARVVYMFNTLQETTRRAAAAAAVSDPRDSLTLDAIRQEAIFQSSSGTLPFGSPISGEHIYIDYLAHVRDGSGSVTLQPIPPSSVASSPARNRQICMTDPHDESCIRFVRVRICQPGSACDAVPYQTLVGLIELPVKLPKATTIVPAESLGYELGSSPGN